MCRIYVKLRKNSLASIPAASIFLLTGAALCLKFRCNITLPEKCLSKRSDKIEGAASSGSKLETNQCDPAECFDIVLGIARPRIQTGGLSQNFLPYAKRGGRKGTDHLQAFVRHHDHHSGSPGPEVLAGTVFRGLFLQHNFLTRGAEFSRLGKGRHQN